MDLRGPHQLGRRGERKGTEGGNLPLSWCPSPLPPLFEPVRLGTPPTPAAPLSRSASPPPPRYGPSRCTTKTRFMSSRSAAPAGRAAVVAVQITSSVPPAESRITLLGDAVHPVSMFKGQGEQGTGRAMVDWYCHLLAGSCISHSSR